MLFKTLHDLVSDLNTKAELFNTLVAHFHAIIMNGAWRFQASKKLQVS